MPTFTELPVRKGYGPWHLNYFRVFIRPTGRPMPTGSELIKLMPTVMDAHTARVSRDHGHRWNGEDTLMFRGVVRVGVPPFAILGHDIPEDMRTFTPDTHHTDSVGLAQAPAAHSFTVQTGKRWFETDDDRYIRRMANHFLTRSSGNSLDSMRERLSRPVPGLPMLDPVRQMLERLAREGRDASRDADRTIAALTDLAVDINQHHFLAGRRAFRMGTAQQLRLVEADFIAAGLPRGPVDGLWAFETAAVERYSLRVFHDVTEKGLGGDAKMLKPVWREMCVNMAGHYGAMVGQVDVQQKNFAARGSAVVSPLYTGIRMRHDALLPGDKRPGD